MRDRLHGREIRHLFQKEMRMIKMMMMMMFLHRHIDMDRNYAHLSRLIDLAD